MQGVVLTGLTPDISVSDQDLPGGGHKQQLAFTLSDPATGDTAELLKLTQVVDENGAKVYLFRDAVPQWLQDLGFQVEANDLFARFPGQDL